MSWDNIFRLYEKVAEETPERDLGEPLADFLSRHHPREIPDELDELTVQALRAMAQYDAGVAIAGVSGMGMRFAARSTLLVTSLLHSAYLIGKQGKPQECSEESGNKEPSWEQAFEELSQLGKLRAEFEKEFPGEDPALGRSVCRLRIFIDSNCSTEVCDRYDNTIRKAFDALGDYLVQALIQSKELSEFSEDFMQMSWCLAGTIFNLGYQKGRTEARSLGGQNND